MKEGKGLDFWVRSSIWLELVIPGYFFGKTFGTADAKFRFIDGFMYPGLFMKLCGYFSSLSEGYYLSRFYGVFSGAILGVGIALLIGAAYKWVLKDWAYAKAARVGDRYRPFIARGFFDAVATVLRGDSWPQLVLAEEEKKKALF